MAAIKICRNTWSDHKRPRVSPTRAIDPPVRGAPAAGAGSSRTVSRNSSASSSGGKPATVKATRQP